MHDVAAVCVVERIADAQDDFQTEHQGLAFVELVDAGRAVLVVELFQVAFECLAVDQLHHEVESVFFVRVQRVDRDDRGMAELGGDARFLEELSACELVLGLRLQCLDCHGAAEVEVDTLADDALAALCEDLAPAVFRVDVLQFHVQLVVETDVGVVHMREGDGSVLFTVEVFQPDRDRGHGMDFA